MMKIPGNNSNGTAEMWEILACRWGWGGDTWAGCDFNSALSPGTKDPATSFRTAAGSWFTYPTFSSAGFGDLGLLGGRGGELWFYGPGTGVWLYLQLQII